ncbi:unnamed protein product, partial [Amoebophrya sp. A120]
FEQRLFTITYGLSSIVMFRPTGRINDRPTLDMLQIGLRVAERVLESNDQIGGSGGSRGGSSSTCSVKKELFIVLKDVVDEEQCSSDEEMSSSFVSGDEDQDVDDDPEQSDTQEVDGQQDQEEDYQEDEHCGSTSIYDRGEATWVNIGTDAEETDVSA